MSSALSDVHAVVEQRCRDADLMYTKGRRELIEILVRAERPVTIPELLELRPKLTQSSMYRNMADLESVGVVQKVVGADQRTRFEPAEELIGHHHHRICEVCGEVADFELSASVERDLDQALSNALVGSGFSVRSHRLDVMGRCGACRPAP